MHLLKSAQRPLGVFEDKENPKKCFNSVLYNCISKKLQLNNNFLTVETG